MSQPDDLPAPQSEPVLAVVLDEARDGLKARAVSGQDEPPSSSPDLEVEEAGRGSDGEDQAGGGALAVSDEEAALPMLAQDSLSHRPADPSMVDERPVTVPILTIFFLLSKVVIGIRSP